ncbi:peptidylprolyl isomerase [Virgibacillus sp. LDC1]|nr:peptidylprolyl isomerase [Virgibacillus sp. LDC1]
MTKVLMGLMVHKFCRLKWLNIVGFLILIIAIIIFIAKPEFTQTHHEDTYIATVDGVEIHISEFQRAIRANRAGIIKYFHEKYDSAQSTDFWSTTYGDETPLELIKKKALEDSIHLKMRQILAKEQGVLSDISYDGFVHNFNLENERRQKAIKNHQVVFGPAQYTEETYFEYVMGNTTLSVKNQLMEHDWKPNEQQLITFYEANKGRLYDAPATVKVRQLSLSFLDASRNVDPLLKTREKKKMEIAREKISSGISFEQAAKDINQGDQVTEQLYNLDSYRHNARSPVAQASANLRPGEVSEIVEENGHFYLIQCMEKGQKGSKYLAFDEIREQVLKDYIDNKYEEYIRERVTDAQVALNEELYRKFQM